MQQHKKFEQLYSQFIKVLAQSAIFVSKFHIEISVATVYGVSSD